MEIKLTVGEILNLNHVLKLIIDDSETTIDSLFKFKLLGIMKSLETHVTNFETIRNEKINKYGKPAENGSVSIPSDDKESIQKFNDDLIKLINSEVSVNTTKFKANDVFDKGVKAEYLIGLYPIIEE